MAEFVPNKPGERRVGRAKGTPNKTTTALKDMILRALDKAGGVKYLAEQAKKNPSAFLTLVGKVLPLQLTGDADNPIEVRVAGARDALAEKLDRIAQHDGQPEAPRIVN